MKDTYDDTRADLTEYEASCENKSLCVDLLDHAFSSSWSQYSWATEKADGWWASIDVQDSLRLRYAQLLDGDRM